MLESPWYADVFGLIWIHIHHKSKHFIDLSLFIVNYDDKSLVDPVGDTISNFVQVNRDFMGV